LARDTPKKPSAGRRAGVLGFGGSSKAKTVQDLKVIRDKAEAVRQYAKQVLRSGSRLG